jgi:hypothetical protein
MQKRLPVIAALIAVALAIALPPFLTLTRQSHGPRVQEGMHLHDVLPALHRY